MECRNPENANVYEARDSTCNRQAAVDKVKGAQDFKAEPGQLFYAAPIDDDLVVGSGLTLLPPSCEDG